MESYCNHYQDFFYLFKKLARQVDQVYNSSAQEDEDLKFEASLGYTISVTPV